LLEVNNDLQVFSILLLTEHTFQTYNLRLIYFV
jgi:hypothetical protein